MRKKSASNQVHRIATDAINQDSSTYRKTILPNGLRIVSEEISTVRSVSIGVWIEVGSRDESTENNGISHFIEHMLFKGTATRSSLEISRSIESVGGYLNAFTSKEQTCYYVRVLDEFAELGIDVLSDIIQNSTFPAKEQEKERSVIIEELKQAEDDPDDIIHDYFEKAVFGSHPMGYPIVGVEKNLRSFQREDLIKFHQRNYIPSKMVIASAGNMNHKKLVELAQKYFSKRNTSRKPGSSYRSKPKREKTKNIEVSKPIQQAHICLGTRAFGVKSTYRFPMLVMNSLLGDGMSSRLFVNIREKYGFAYNVFSFVNMLSDTGSFGVYIGTDKNHVDRCLALIRKELDKLVKKPISKAELDRTKAQLKGGMMLSLENIPSRMLRLGSSEIYFHELSSLDSIIRQIDSVNQDDLQKVAGELFSGEKYSTVIFKPTASKDEA